MAKPYVLIDFENVQPKTLDRLQPGAVRIKVFLGQHQNRLMLELVQALQPFGADAEYIAIQGSGPDAVDFHIAFYIGRLAAEDPGAAFTIISRDKGFDPLVRHLVGLGIPCQRVPDIEGASAAAKPAAKKAAAKAVQKAVPKVAAKKAPARQPAAKQAPARQAPAKQAAAKQATAAAPAAKAAVPSAAKGTSTRTAEVIARLKKSSKPAKMTTLRSSIKSWFKPALDDKAVDAIVQSLQGTGKITVDGTKVAYAL